MLAVSALSIFVLRSIGIAPLSSANSHSASLNPPSGPMNNEISELISQSFNASKISIVLALLL